MTHPTSPVSSRPILANEKSGPFERDHKITYWLVTPDKTHKSFAIKWRRKSLDGKPLGNGSFKDERTSVLNTLFKSQKKKHSQTEAEFRAILRDLQDKENQLRGELGVLAENEVLLEIYLKKRYSQNISKKRNKDIETAKNESKRAIQAAGKISLISGDSGEIMDAVLEFCENKCGQFNKYLRRIKGILKTNGLHAKADDLMTLREPPNEVTYITYKQLNDLVDHIRKSGRTQIAKVSTETFIALIQFLFWSGLRIGEAAAAKASYMDTEARVLRVDWQIDDDGVKRLPKYDKRRKTHIPKQGLVHFYSWIKASDRDGLDRKQATKILKKFCQKLFSDPIYHISLHGLRHSYALVMLRHFEGTNGKRFTLDDVADYLVTVAKLPGSRRERLKSNEA